MTPSSASPGPPMPAIAPDPASTPKAQTRPSQAFVTKVLDLCEDKAARAALRSGQGRPVDQCNRLHRYLVRLTPPNLHADARRAHYAVAALIAAWPRATRDGDAATSVQEVGTEPAWSRGANLGASMAEGVRIGALAPNSAEGELHLITRQSSAALHPRLPALTRHLLTKGASVDWAVLLEDLTWWDRDRDRIATRWLESYFRALYAASQDDAQKPTETQKREDS